MASPYITKLAKEFGKPSSEIESLWKKAKDITSDTFNKEEKNFEEREYNYTIGIVKQMLGMNEEILDPSNFLESELTAKEYLETLTSGDFPSLNKTIINKSKKPLEDDEPEPEIVKDEDPKNKKKKVEDPKKKKVQTDEEIREELNKVLAPLEQVDPSDLDKMIEENTNEDN